MNWLDEYIYLDALDVNRHRLYHYTRTNLAIQVCRRLHYGSPVFMANQIKSILTGLYLCWIAFTKETALYIMGPESEG